MKYLITLTFLIAPALGEVPAPYPASGWRPQGPAFELPSENNSRLKQALPQTIPPSTSYGVPEIPYPVPGAQQNLAPQNQYGPPTKQQLAPQTQYGAPQRLPPTQLGPPQIPQNQQQQQTAPQNQYGAPSSSSAPQNQYGPPISFTQKLPPQSQQQLPPQNQYGAPSNSFPFQPTEIKLTAQQQQQLLSQLIKLQQFLSSQKRQQVAPPQNEYGAPPSSVDVRSGGGGGAAANNPQNQYEPPPSVEPLNGDRNNQFTPNTQYLPSFLSSGPSFRNENNDGKGLSSNGERNSFDARNQNQDDGDYKTIVLTRQEEDDYNKKYGPPNPPPPPSPPVLGGRRRPQSIPEAPKEETPDGEENFDDASSVDPNISVANAFASGRYYLLLPDGRLQKVTYKTSQSEDEARANGFTANLMYQLVEPIKDPIYTVDGTPYAPQ